MIKVWDLGVRSFHWLLVAAVAFAATTGFLAPRNWLNFHLAAGAVIAALLAFRLVWGFAGPTYARFASFIFPPAAIIGHLRAALARRSLGYAGHNPLGGLMVFALLAVLAALAVAGIVTLGGADKQGPLAFAVPYRIGETARTLHKALAYLLMALIGLHLAGVAFESMIGRERLIGAMATGWKRAATLGTARLARARPALAAVAVGLLIGGGGLGVAAWSARPAFGVPPVAIDPVYARECGSCHMPYPPSLAPRARWAALMNGLADHFGEDASLEPPTKAAILAWLSDNSAERWDTRAAHEFARANPADPLRITATPYWATVHRGVPASVFKSKAVAAPGNCLACHADAMTGRFDPQQIQIPEQAL